MATSINRGGGFSIGVLYGLIASVVLYLVLVFLFPLNPSTTSVAPLVMDSAGVQMPAGASAAPEMPAGTAPEAPVAQMAQPDTGESSGISVGGAGDTGPVSGEGATTQVAAEASVSAPTVETESTGLPDIGAGASATAAPDESQNATTITTENVENAGQQATAPGELSASVSGPATEVFAVAFTGDSSKPMLAIVLEDTLETSLQPLVDTGAPLSFALPAGEDSRESAQSIRESGYEVLAMLPSSLSRADNVAEKVAEYMQNVPVAVAVIDARLGGIMLNRNKMQEVLEATRPAGLGIVTFAGTGDLVARDQALRAGAPYGNVVQIIDKTPDEELIVQALDRAAFDALTKGSSIVFARTKPETINAIVRWLGGAFAARLEIVPVSVAIQRSTN